VKILDKKSAYVNVKGDDKRGDEKKSDKPSSKLRTDDERLAVRKREHKALMKSLTMAQLSTGSMGKFDKKVKNEPDAPKTQKLVKKKSNKVLGDLEANRGNEKNRNMKIFDQMSRAKEVEAPAAKKKHIKSVKVSRNKRVKK